MLYIVATLLRWKSITWVSRLLALLFLVLLALLGPTWQLAFQVPAATVGASPRSAMMAIFSAYAFYALIHPDQANHTVQGAFRTIFSRSENTATRLARHTVAIGLAIVLIAGTLQFLSASQGQPCRGCRYSTGASPLGRRFWSPPTTMPHAA
jgi:hypothetical protein